MLRALIESLDPSITTVPSLRRVLVVWQSQILVLPVLYSIHIVNSNMNEFLNWKTCSILVYEGKHCGEFRSLGNMLLVVMGRM